MAKADMERNPYVTYALSPTWYADRPSSRDTQTPSPDDEKMVTSLTGPLKWCEAYTKVKCLCERFNAGTDLGKHQHSGSGEDAMHGKRFCLEDEARLVLGGAGKTEPSLEHLTVDSFRKYSPVSVILSPIALGNGRSSTRIIAGGSLGCVADAGLPKPVEC